MSKINYTSSSSYSSSSYSSTTANGGNPQTQSQSYSEQRNYNPRDGHTVTRSAQKDGGPVYRETTTVPGNRTLGDTSGQGRITDVTDDDKERGDVDRAAREREYEERMEDEYAKREGGA